MAPAGPGESINPDIASSALIVVDMQNDFVSEGGYFDRVAKKYPEVAVDREFLGSTVPNIKRLIAGFRSAGRPVVYVQSILLPDFSDAHFPYWFLPDDPGPVESQFIVGGTWGAEIVDELKPAEGETVVIKKGFNGFHQTSLEAVLRDRGVTTCVMTGVTTCVCVSSTTRAGVERDFRMIFVSDSTAEVRREWHEAELRAMDWAIARVKTTDEVLGLLERAPNGMLGA
jgi:nicotinamidase-related amidase